MSERNAERWLSFSGTVTEWIAKQATIGRRFVAADNVVYKKGSSRVKFRYAHPPNDPSEMVAIQGKYSATTTLYHPSLELSA